MKYIKKALQSDVNAETDLFKYLSLFSSVKLTSLFSDVWKLCNKEWHDNRGSIFLQQYLHIRPLQVTGMQCIMSFIHKLHVHEYHLCVCYAAYIYLYQARQGDVHQCLINYDTYC